MEDPTLPPPISQKRPREDDVEPSVSTPVRAIHSEASTPLSVLSVRTPSPSPMKPLVAFNSIAPNSSSVASSQAAPDSSNKQPAKRRKLTTQDKEAQRLEKEAKAKALAEKRALKEADEKAKAEQKAQREEEKRLKDEEKQKKVEEREEKRRQKEEEQRAKEEEKAKKERSQMRLGAFFAKPKAVGVSPGQLSVESSQNPLASTVSLLPSSAAAATNSAPPSPQKNIAKNAQCDYERYFLPFTPFPHTILAPKNAFMEDAAKLEAAQLRLESIISRNGGHTEPVNAHKLKALLPSCSGRGLECATIADVIECVNESSDQPVDLTSETAPNPRRPLDMLTQIPMKYIHFGEDVRPPYYGTYTQSYTGMEASRLARNPLARFRQDTNYDYDSEAEWDEPEEGEDLDSEGDDDDNDEAEDDMEGFLDDEEDSQLKRRLISGDLQPVSTGLCWQDPDGMSRLNDGSGAICTDFREFSMGFLLHPQLHSIDPMSTAYWAPDPALIAPPPVTTAKDASNNGSMNPPRAPLAQRTMNGLLNTLNSPQQSSPGMASKPAKARRMIPSEHMPAFKAEIEGKDLTKIGMVEALKKMFPKIPKDAITNTLSVVAARVGPTEKEKRWVLINT
ncbi:chromatin assembly factor 1 subunit A-domain-containing protein [Paraphoma chrysanthemicola]|nr:chromatin assembly factor 1 subunit A-domain-containing protein [Paraphoma chrysanthemicola]